MTYNTISIYRYVYLISLSQVSLRLLLYISAFTTRKDSVASFSSILKTVFRKLEGDIEAKTLFNL